MNIFSIQGWYKHFYNQGGAKNFAPGGINIYAGDAVVNGKEERHKWEQSENKNI